MLFLKISNANILFGKKILIWRIYITNKTLPTTKQVQIIDKKDFIITILDADNKMFMIYMGI